MRQLPWREFGLGPAFNDRVDELNFGSSGATTKVMMAYEIHKIRAANGRRGMAAPRTPAPASRCSSKTSANVQPESPIGRRFSF